MSFPFDRLPRELQLEVMHQCDRADLVRFVRVCSAMYSTGLEILYRDVDISCHNETGLFRCIYQTSMVHGNNPLRSIERSKMDSLHHRQESFVETILRRPALGVHVKSLTWTYLCSYHTWVGVERASERMPMAFGSLNKIERLDLCSFNQEYPAITAPRFETLTHMSIGGRLSYMYFQKIILRPAQLVSLVIDNVQDFGVRQGGMDVELSDEPNLIMDTATGYGHPVHYHGPMQGHLRSLVDRCTSLRYLVIRTVGQEDSKDTQWSTRREEQRYLEMAEFIVSTSQTLESLVFEQGGEPADSRNPIRPGYDTRGFPRPMDIYFAIHVLPMLAKTSWLKLQKVAVRGVVLSSSNELTSESMSGLNAIAASSDREVLGKKVALDWDLGFSTTFYLHARSPFASPLGFEVGGSFP